jgi:3-hydroxyacyl-[acyl-carrier-protein] dehydratase
MRFRLIDRITQLDAGKHIEGVKYLSADEGYLADHFPKFPIMPGVLMLEAMYQAGLWLVRKTEDFAHAMVELHEARNVKFSGFVKPGQTLVVTADVKKQDGNRTSLVTQGTVDGKVVASARLVLEAFQLADRYPHWAASHDYFMRNLRRQFERVASGTPESPANTKLSMRWLWIDRFVEFVRGERAVAIKNVSLTEEPLNDYLPGFAVLPCSLVVEGLAWAGGILANDQRGFQERTVLAKVNRAVFHRPAFAGDQLRYTAVMEALEPEGAFIRGTSHVGDELQAEVDLFLAHLGDRFEEVEGDLIDPADMLAMLRLWGLCRVGRTASGDPLDVAEKLLDGERKAQAAAQEAAGIT